MTAPTLRPLSAGETLDVAFGIYRRLFVPLVTVAVATTAIPLLLNIFIEASGGAFSNVPLFLLNAVLSIVFGSVATAASVFIISENYLGRTLAAGDALRNAMPYVGRIFLLSLLTSFLVGFGLILFIAPGLILLAGLALSTPTLVVENCPGAIDAMGRSWALSRGFRAKVLGLVLVVFLIMYLPIMGLGVVSGVMMAMSGAVPGASTPVAFAVGIGAVTGLVQMLISPMLYATLTVAYYDLRVRKEGFDLEVLAAGLHAV